MFAPHQQRSQLERRPEVLCRSVQLATRSSSRFDSGPGDQGRRGSRLLGHRRLRPRAVGDGRPQRAGHGAAGAGAARGSRRWGRAPRAPAPTRGVPDARFGITLTSAGGQLRRARSGAAAPCSTGHARPRSPTSGSALDCASRQPASWPWRWQESRVHRERAVLGLLPNHDRIARAYLFAMGALVGEQVG